MKKNKDIMTMQQTADYLSKSYSWMRKTGKNLIPHFRAGQRILFKKSEVDQWIDDNTVQPEG